MSENLAAERSPVTTPQSAGTGSTGSGQTVSAPRTSSVQLKKALAAADGYDAQLQMLATEAPVQFADGKGGVHAAAAHGISGGGGALPHGGAIQKAFGGYDISHVRAHSDSAATRANEAMGADAYATGSNIAFKGAPDLHTAAHEAAHVVQQQAGVQLSGGVGTVGDPYERHADKVADAVVQGKSAEPILAEMAGGGTAGGGVQKMAVQQRRKKRDKGDPNAIEADRSQQLINTDGGAKGGPNPSNEDVMRYLELFKARVRSAFAQGKMDSKIDPNLVAEKVFYEIWGALQTSEQIAAPEMSDKVDGRLNVKMAEEAYQKAIKQVSAIAKDLATMSKSQFMKATSFGFWSKNEGRQLTEKISELTLETSGIGSVFDGIPTLNKDNLSWDPELWGGLSQAYGAAVAEQVVQGGKTINVCVGAEADRANNIWTEVERTAVETTLRDAGMTLEDVTTYWAAGATDRKTRELRTNLGAFDSRDAAIDAADKDWQFVPVDKTQQLVNEDGPVKKPEGPGEPEDADVARYFEVFKARVIAAFAKGRMSNDEISAEDTAKDVWTRITAKLQSTAAITEDSNMAESMDGGAWFKVKMTENVYQEAIKQISAIAGELGKMSSSQFDKAKSFGFWSRPEGRALGERISELTLETSGIGSVFDGIPTLNKSQAVGWDPELWGGLSQAYAQAVGKQLVGGKKRVNVCVGANADKVNNIWTEVEKTRLADVVRDAGVNFEDFTTYWAAGATNRKERGLRANLGKFATRDEAIEAANKDWQTIPHTPKS